MAIASSAICNSGQFPLLTNQHTESNRTEQQGRHSLHSTLTTLRPTQEQLYKNTEKQ